MRIRPAADVRLKPDPAGLQLGNRLREVWSSGQPMNLLSRYAQDLSRLRGVIWQVQRGTAEGHHGGRVVVGQLGDLERGVHDRRTYPAHVPRRRDGTGG